VNVNNDVNGWASAGIGIHNLPEVVGKPVAEIGTSVSPAFGGRGGADGMENVKVLEKFSAGSTAAEPQPAIATAKDMEQLAESLKQGGNLEQAAEAYLKAAEMYAKNENFAKAALCYRKAVELYLQIKDAGGITAEQHKNLLAKVAEVALQGAEMYMDAAKACERNSNFAMAAWYYRKAVKLYLHMAKGKIIPGQRQNLLAKAAEAYLKVAEMFKQSENFAKAALCCRKAAELYLQMANAEGISPEQRQDFLNSAARMHVESAEM
jgi:tetratricopeptide (TPR) repeat protein